MMADQALLNAVNKAIEALQEVKRELEREDTTPQEASVEAQPEPKIAPPFQTLAPEVELQEEPPSAPEPQPTPEVSQSKPQTSQYMVSAVKIAAAVCQQWKFQDEADNIIDVSLLEYSAGEQDGGGMVDHADPESYYIVSPDGAIGLTENDGESIEWLFLPLNRSVASLPKKLKKGEPWPEKNIAPAQQSVPISAPAMTENVCPKCGKAFNPGSKFCMGCGAQLSAPAPAPAPVAPRGSFCKGCGAPLKSGDKFCMKCGARV